jgi:hypothetical protein
MTAKEHLAIQERSATETLLCVQSGSKHEQTGEIARSSRDKVFIYNIHLCWEFLTIPPQTYHKFSHEHFVFQGRIQIAKV